MDAGPMAEGAGLWNVFVWTPISIGVIFGFGFGCYHFSQWLQKRFGTFAMRNKNFFRHRRRGYEEFLEVLEYFKITLHR